MVGGTHTLHTTGVFGVSTKKNVEYFGGDSTVTQAGREFYSAFFLAFISFFMFLHRNFYLFFLHRLFASFLTPRLCISKFPHLILVCVCFR